MKPDPKSFTYKHIFNKYFDLETVRWDELISEENWDVEARSETELEHNRDKLSKDAARRRNADSEKESRMISPPEVGLPVTRTETSLAVKLAKKKSRTKRSKKILDGLYFCHQRTRKKRRHNPQFIFGKIRNKSGAPN